MFDEDDDEDGGKKKKKKRKRMKTFSFLFDDVDLIKGRTKL